MSSMYFKFSGTYITFLPRQTISASYVTLQFFDFLSWKKVGYRSLFQSTNAHQVSRNTKLQLNLTSSIESDRVIPH
ncbi:hypothetical protein SUGI_0051130 [Cryptomeria japonica]|nr:hypothetical protein SUGI_0051130 [Cryptomeria japonica]